MSTPDAISLEGLISSDVKAKPTALRKEPTATNFSLFLSLIIVSMPTVYRGKPPNLHHQGCMKETKT